MCCGGDYDGLAEVLAAPPEGVLMAKVWTTVKGAVQQIGTYGEASNDTPAIVPDDVARELDGLDGFKVERDQPAKKTATKGRA
jgi:hypothetical protein